MRLAIFNNGFIPGHSLSNFFLIGRCYIRVFILLRLRLFGAELRIGKADRNQFPKKSLRILKIIPDVTKKEDMIFDLLLRFFG